MKKLRAKFESIREAKGNQKLSLLKSYFQEEGNELLLEVIDFCMNPRFKTGISNKINKPLECFTEYTINNIQEMMDLLRKNNTGRNGIVKSIQDFMERNPNESDFIAQIATQSLKWEMGASSVNKVVGKNFIPQHKILKPEKLDPKHILWMKKNKKEIAIYEKKEGYREEVRLNGKGSVDILSSSGDILNTVNNEWIEIEEALSKLDKVGMLSCEVIAINKWDYDRMDLFKKTGSIIKKKNTQKKGLVLNVFDFIPDDGFYTEECELTMKERKELARQIVEEVNSPFVQFIEPLYVGYNYDMIDECFNDMCSQKNEGIVICVLDSLFVGKKTYTCMMKMKTGKEVDIRVVGFNEGEKGKQFEGTLGTLTVDYKGHNVKCSLGFKTLYKSNEYDDRLVRDYIWNHQEELLGKIVRVGFMDEIKTKGSLDLRFCTLIEWRDDKTEPSYN